MITHKHSLREIIAAVARADGARVEDVVSKRVTWDYVRRRFAVIVIAREDGYGLSELGRAIKRDHTTVLAAARRVEYHRRCKDVRWGQIQDLMALTKGVLASGVANVRSARRLREGDIAAAATAVVRIVCARTDTKVADVMGNRMRGESANARRIAVWLIAEGLAVPTVSIASLFRRRTHTVGEMVRHFDPDVLSPPWHQLCAIIKGTVYLHDGVARLGAMADREEATANGRQDVPPRVRAAVRAAWVARARQLRGWGWAIQGIADQVNARPDDVAVVVEGVRQSRR